MRAKSKYPVGAKWVAENEKGWIEIWLDQRTPYVEFWRWSFCNPDGSSSGGWDYGDWGTSYRMCYEMCAWKLHINGKIPRFKRVRSEP